MTASSANSFQFGMTLYMFYFVNGSTSCHFLVSREIAQDLADDWGAIVCVEVVSGELIYDITPSS